MESAIKSLVELGFSEDEAKAYCVLLEESPLSGYVVAQRTGIVRAHIYEILESLYRKGCVTHQLWQCPRVCRSAIHADTQQLCPYGRGKPEGISKAGGAICKRAKTL